MKSLIAYFSHGEENYNVGFIQKGNTEKVAEIIKTVLEAKGQNAELFEIKPAKPYLKEYNEYINVAKKELNSKAHPEIESFCDVSGYDTIYLGYPNWWGDLPMCVYTFLEKCGKLKEKTVVPFCTHEGSGISGIEKGFKSAAKGCVLQGTSLSMAGHDAQKNDEKEKSAVKKWLGK